MRLQKLNEAIKQQKEFHLLKIKNEEILMQKQLEISALQIVHMKEFHANNIDIQNKEKMIKEAHLEILLLEKQRLQNK